MKISIECFIVLSVLGLGLSVPTHEQVAHEPITHVINTPYGQQVITQHIAPDGSHFWSSAGPGFSQSSFSSGSFGNPNDGTFQYNGMNTGAGNNYAQHVSGNGFQGMSMGSAMGSYSGASMMGDGVIHPMPALHFAPFAPIAPMAPMAPMAPIQPMAPMQPMHFPKFKFWPSIFDNHDSKDD